ncbi:MAG: hypothetical protein WD492_12840 [Alkalispirochaeta sp.]
MDAEPVLQAIVTADRVVTEDNGKKVIVGTFNRFMAEKFPTMFPPWGVYVSFSNLKGEFNFSINLTSEETQQVLSSMGGTVKSAEYSDVHEITLMHAPVFHQPGKYHLSLYIEGKTIGSRIIRVEQRESTN